MPLYLCQTQTHSHSINSSVSGPSVWNDSHRLYVPHLRQVVTLIEITLSFRLIVDLFCL